MKKAVINDIKRFAVHDGDGIRTTVFFKGCPLKLRSRGVAGSEQPGRVPKGGWQVEEVVRRGWKELEKALRFPFRV